MVDVVERTRAAVVQDPNLAVWFASVHGRAVAALELAVDWVAAGAARVSRQAWLRAETAAAARVQVRDLGTAINHPNTGYRQRLIDRICCVCQRPMLRTTEWLKLDTELRLMAAISLAEGRSNARYARVIARAIARARDTADAAERLRKVLESPSESYVAAFTMGGVRQPRSTRAFDLQLVDPSAPQWRETAEPTADAALASLVSSAPDKTYLTAAVDAFDFEHAASLAWQRGERLADQYGAQHRTYRIAVAEPMLVLRVSDGMISEQSPAGRDVPKAKPRLSRPEPRLEQSLRYAALARAERSPVVQILHSWIALETLARGRGAPKGPYQLLMHELAPALAVQAVRQNLAMTWHIASRAGRRGIARDRWLEVERWLGIHGNHRNLPDLNRWVDLLRHDAPTSLQLPAHLRADASLDEASVVFLELLPTMVPFAREGDSSLALATGRW